MGVFLREKAFEMAREKEMDLVEFSPSVCKILDYKKFRYGQNKQNKKHNKVIIKEIQIRTNVSDHDLNTKMNSIRKFLNAGDSIKLLITSRGRQIDHPELNVNILHRIMREFGDAIFEGLSQNGRQLSCLCRKK